jgi:hypothetical protein
MKAKRKKFIALFLIFSLVMLSANLYAKERRGAKLIVTKKDGQRIKGELITVKPNSLLLLNTKGRDVSVKIEEIKEIVLMKRVNALGGAIAGFLVGGLVGGKISVSGESPFSERYDETALIGILIGGALGLLSGILIVKNLAGKEKIQIEGMTDSEIQETLDKLRKKARICDYR